MWDEATEFADPVLEQRRRIGQCALLLANAKRWDTTDAARCHEYMTRFNKLRKKYALAWSELAPECGEGQVAWATARILTMLEET